MDTSSTRRTKTFNAASFFMDIISSQIPFKTAPTRRAKPAPLPKTLFGLLNLPAEVRNQIYDYTLDYTRGSKLLRRVLYEVDYKHMVNISAYPFLHWRTKRAKSTIRNYQFLRVCRQIYQEAMHILSKKRMPISEYIVPEPWRDKWDFDDKITSVTVQYVRNIVITSPTAIGGESPKEVYDAQRWLALSVSLMLPRMGKFDICGS
ncbi:hypothetical protein EJ08DRAFT_695882 [Tothia fuscella]|uniref:F-box domain-containing protein n=1 Tax=Tothia fuscella TaxID=1048955 RepID=A0A9P4U0N4_9PEZI|nr:hypothetical protein EJ08DRAFT_695882 [Tothia fuscella]